MPYKQKLNKQEYLTYLKRNYETWEIVMFFEVGCSVAFGWYWHDERLYSIANTVESIGKEDVAFDIISACEALRSNGIKGDIIGASRSSKVDIC